MTSNHTEASSRNDTNSLLRKTKFPCLRRHERTRHYYAVKKIQGKIKQEVLKAESGEPIADEKLARVALDIWTRKHTKRGKLEEVGGKIVTARTFAEHLDVFCKSNGCPTMEEVKEFQERNKKAGVRAKSIVPNPKKNIIWCLNRMADTWRIDFNEPLSKISHSEISTFLSAQKEPVKSKSEKDKIWKGLKRNGFNELHRQLKNIFGLAAADGVIEKSPFKIEGGHTITKRVKVKRDRDVIPTEEQFTKIIQHIRSVKSAGHAEDSGDLAEFLGTACLGEAEADWMHWEHINLETDWMRVKRIKTGEFFDVPIYKNLKPLLVSMNAERDDKSPGAKVFKVSSCKAALKSACKKMGYPHFSPRLIRKYGIERLLRKGVSYKRVSQWQGHTDGGILILSTYSYVLSGSDSDQIAAELAKV